MALADLELLASGKAGLSYAQGLVGRFGALLSDWPDIVAASRELKARGEELATLVTATFSSQSPDG